MPVLADVVLPVGRFCVVGPGGSGFLLQDSPISVRDASSQSK